MGEKKIVIDIDENGKIHAETFGMVGTECMNEIDKLMKDIASRGSFTKKPEFYKQRTEVNNMVNNKNG